MSKSSFIKQAGTLSANVAGTTVSAEPRKFSSGSVGFYFNNKVTLPDGTRLQFSGNAVVIGSKDWPD